MRILFLLSDGRDAVLDRLIELESREHAVTVIDMSRRDLAYDGVVDEICAHEKVISW